MFSLVHTLPGYRATSDTLWSPACLQRATREQQPILFVEQQPRIGKHNFISRKPILKGSTAGLKAASRRRAGRHAPSLRVVALIVAVEPAGGNSRCCYAGINIKAPIDSVWTALTDYDGLGDLFQGWQTIGA